MFNLPRKQHHALPSHPTSTAASFTLTATQTDVRGCVPAHARSGTSTSCVLVVYCSRNSHCAVCWRRYRCTRMSSRPDTPARCSCISVTCVAVENASTNASMTSPGTPTSSSASIAVTTLIGVSVCRSHHTPPEDTSTRPPGASHTSNGHGCFACEHEGNSPKGGGHATGTTTQTGPQVPPLL